MIDLHTVIPAILREINDTDSHTERDTATFHASQIGYCKRQIYNKKLGLADVSNWIGSLIVGLIIHQWLETQMEQRYEYLKLEQPVTVVIDGIRFVGTYDMFNPQTQTVTDWKTRNGFHNLSLPIDRHIDQLYPYMLGTGAEKARIVYLNKANLDIRQYPALDSDKDGIRFDPNRLETIVHRVATVKDIIQDEGIATCKDEHPFEPCGCYFCDSEQLRFPDNPTLEESPLTDVSTLANMDDLMTGNQSASS